MRDGGRHGGWVRKAGTDIRKENELERMTIYKPNPQSLPSMMYILQQGHTSETFPDSTINWGPYLSL